MMSCATVILMVNDWKLQLAGLNIYICSQPDRFGSLHGRVSGNVNVMKTHDDSLKAA